ncbi:MAG: SH3 domain-containing protein [Chloroflexi bacterium]|nr:SH3 domain-containing protein [Chloroflexota bacterium]
MRLPWLFVIFALCFGQVAAQDAAPNAIIPFQDHPARVVTNINGLNVRSTPAIENDNIVGRLPPGQQVHVLARDGDWQQVRGENGLFGWSHSDYLIDLPPRQIGETRLFQIYDENTDSGVRVNAELHHIGPHSYIYVAVNPQRNVTLNHSELEKLAEAFDEEIYPNTYALWAPDPKPSHHGDERIVIVVGVGYRKSNVLTGAYHRRGDMPGELFPNRSRTGFISIEMSWHGVMSTRFLLSVAAHELQHLFQHQIDGDEERWINEGLSVLTNAYLDYFESERVQILPVQEQPYAQLNLHPDVICGYGCGFLFTSFILERLGLEGLRDFTHRPENGLAALDATLVERGDGLDTETFYADFVLANYLRDAQLADGRYGYQLLSSVPFPKPYVRGNIVALPTLVQQSLPIYGTDYYDFALPENDKPQSLELALDFPNSAVQDGWLQFVQVVNGEVILERFRASEHRDQMIPAELYPDAEQAFLAISPFNANARHLTARQPYSLRIHVAGSEVAAADYAAIESSLSPKPTHTTAHSTPGLLTLELQATIDELIEKKYMIYAENKTGEYIIRVEELIAAGAVLNDKKGSALLVDVVMHLQPNPELLAVLLGGGANPNQGDYGIFTPGAGSEFFDSSPLNLAIAFAVEAHVKLLLDAGATVDNSALLVASYIGNAGIIQRLLDARENASFDADDVIAAAEIARQYQNRAAADLLEAAAARMN